jgi:hypothetical protein
MTHWPRSVVALVGHLAKLNPHLERLLTHVLSRGNVALGSWLQELGIEVLILKAAVLLDIMNGGSVEHLFNARPVACSHAHWAWLAGGVDHAASQVGVANLLGGIADGEDLSVPVRCVLRQRIALGQVIDGVTRMENLMATGHDCSVVRYYIFMHQQV